MSKTKKVISVVLAAALVMAMATVAMVSASAATTVYFENSEGWGEVYAYVWGGALGEEFGAWPGSPATLVEGNVWSADIPDDCTNVIFNNNNNGAQTNNLENIGGGVIAKLGAGTEVGEFGEIKTVYAWEQYGDAPVDTTAAPDTTVAEVETTVAEVETTVAEVETTVAEVETTVAEPVETTVAEPEETTAAAEADGIVVGGEEYTANVGDVVTYTFTLKTPKAIENIQATTKYDAAKLKLVDTTVAERFPNMTGVVANAADGAVYFNASEISAGFDFTAGATLVTLQFEVLDASYSEITTTIEEMVEFFGIDYITGGEIVADGVEVAETLTVPEVEDSTPVTTTEATVATTEATVATTEAPATTKAPVADPTGTTGESGKNPDVPGTGSSVAIYAVLATLAMAAAAVVVLRKKVNG